MIHERERERYPLTIRQALRTHLINHSELSRESGVNLSKLYAYRSGVGKLTKRERFAIFLTLKQDLGLVVRYLDDLNE